MTSQELGCWCGLLLLVTLAWKLPLLIWEDSLAL